MSNNIELVTLRTETNAENTETVTYQEIRSLDGGLLASVRVFRPVLTDEERAKRMAAIEQATARLIMNTERAKRERLRRESQL